MSVKTILVAHRSLAVRDRFAAALADAQQDICSPAPSRPSARPSPMTARR
jgi:hypothetical protein